MTFFLSRSIDDASMAGVCDIALARGRALSRMWFSTVPIAMLLFLPPDTKTCAYGFGEIERVQVSI